MRFVIVGLTITSSWGNGHATTYRGLVRELERLGHDVLFLEHDKPYYAAHRDLPRPAYGRTELYTSVVDLQRRFREDVQGADVVILGSYVPEGVRVGEWLLDAARGPVAFYDIDTPVTLAKLQRQDHEYLHPDLIPRFAAYFSFTGGPTLDHIRRAYGARQALALYCSVDPTLYAPEDIEKGLDLGYLGTFSDDRQPALERLLVEPARRWPAGRFFVAGPRYPAHVQWPSNVERKDHLPPSEHRRFYNRQRFTLNVTRAAMVEAGYSPSVRLFEAAACGVAIITDRWSGIEEVLAPGKEILVADNSDDALRFLRETSEGEREAIGRRARDRVLGAHTAAHRARELEAHARRMTKEVPTHA